MSREKSVLKLIQYSLGRKRKSFGHGYEAGYHTVNLRGKEFQGQRDMSKRLAQVDYDFKDKTVLDLGCCTGGMLHRLAPKIKNGIGVDYNYKCINAANRISTFNGTQNLSFYTLNLDKEPLKLLNYFVDTDHLDICFVLSIALWVKKWREVVQWCYESSDSLLYEAHGKEDFQKRQIDHIKSIYPHVSTVALKAVDDHESSKSKGKLNRKTFLCKK